MNRNKRIALAIFILFFLVGIIAFSMNEQVHRNGNNIYPLNTVVEGTPDNSVPILGTPLPIGGTRHAGFTNGNTSNLLADSNAGIEDFQQEYNSGFGGSQNIDISQEGTSNVLKSVQNFIETMYGPGSIAALTGDANAMGNSSENTVANQAQAIASSGGQQTAGQGCQDGSSSSTTAKNNIGVDIDNKGIANATSGNANAVGIIAQDMVNTNLAINVALGVLQENSTSNIYVGVVYNIITSLFANSTAITGDANAMGNSSENTVANQAQAIASSGGQQTAGQGCQDGSSSSTTAKNNIGVDIDNKGIANATSGNAKSIINAIGMYNQDDEITIDKNGPGNTELNKEYGNTEEIPEDLIPPVETDFCNSNKTNECLNGCVCKESKSKSEDCTDIPMEYGIKNRNDNLDPDNSGPNEENPTGTP